MADKVAQLSANGGQPTLEITVNEPGDLIRGRFTIFLFDKTDTKSIVIGGTDKKVDNPNGTFPIPIPDNDLNNLDDCWIRYRVFVSDDDSTGDWFLTIKIFQDGQIVDGGNIRYKANLDSFDFIGDKVRLNVS